MSTRQTRAARIGIFVVLGLLLLVATVLATAGGRLFAKKDHVVMHFGGSIYGLQVGAPVVFRGVRLGSVTAIGLVYDGSSDQFTIPVTADLDRDTVRQLLSTGQTGRDTMPLATLIGKGLSAQLSMQSLLTGQLYVDLDLRPQRVAASSRHDPQLTEIPTSATAIQNLKAQLDGMDFRRLLDDVSVVAASVRQITTGPALQGTLDDLRSLSANLNRLSGKLDRQVDPLSQSAQRALGDARQLMGSLKGNSVRLDDTLTRFGSTADQAGALLAPESPLLQRLQHTADELARTAAALREQTSGEAPLAQNLDRTLQDMSRAARAVRQLADTLDQQPQSLLRGKPAPPPPFNAGPP